MKSLQRQQGLAATALACRLNDGIATKPCQQQLRIQIEQCLQSLRAAHIPRNCPNCLRRKTCRCQAGVKISQGRQRHSTPVVSGHRHARFFHKARICKLRIVCHQGLQRLHRTMVHGNSNDVFSIEASSRDRCMLRKNSVYSPLGAGAHGQSTHLLSRIPELHQPLVVLQQQAQIRLRVWAARYLAQCRFGVPEGLQARLQVSFCQRQWCQADRYRGRPSVDVRGIYLGMAGTYAFTHAVNWALQQRDWRGAQGSLSTEASVTVMGNDIVFKKMKIWLHPVRKTGDALRAGHIGVMHVLRIRGEFARCCDDV